MLSFSSPKDNLVLFDQFHVSLELTEAEYMLCNIIQLMKASKSVKLLLYFCNSFGEDISCPQTALKSKN